MEEADPVWGKKGVAAVERTSMMTQYGPTPPPGDAGAFFASCIFASDVYNLPLACMKYPPQIPEALTSILQPSQRYAWTLPQRKGRYAGGLS